MLMSIKNLQLIIVTIKDKFTLQKRNLQIIFFISSYENNIILCKISQKFIEKYSFFDLRDL